MITYLSKLDMRPGSVAPVLHVSQYDSDFQINFDLWASSGDFVIESGTTATVRGTKLDGNGYSAECVLDGKRVTVAGHIQMTAIAGQQVFEITLHKGEKELNSANFILDVERAAMDKDTFTSDSEILEAYAIVDRTDEIVAAAKKVENAVSSIDETIATELVKLAKETNIGLSDRSKIALLNCLRHLAWIDQQGQTYYDELEDALYEQDIKAVVSIDAVFTQGSLIVYEDTSLESLRDYLTVTATYTDQSTKEVINYNLSGTLREGTSTVTVEYGSKRDTFSVVVSGNTEVESITASFNQGTAVFYEDSSLDELKPYLTVTAHYSDDTSQTVTNYSLSGTLNVGSSTITVEYLGKRTTFTVIVSERVVLVSISAVFDSGSSIIYTDDSLNSLKQYLTVTAQYSDGTSAVVNDYTLSGNLIIGSNTIVVSYNNKTTSFSAVAVMRFSTIYGAPQNDPTDGFMYRKNLISATTNPMAFSVPSGIYEIVWNDLTDYYFSIAAVLYDEEQYPNLDFLVSQSDDSKIFIPLNDYTINWFGGGWKNTSTMYIIPSDYTRLFINFRKGTSNVDLTEEDISKLSTAYIRRIYPDQITDWSVENGLLNMVVASAINRTDGNVALADVGISQNRRTFCARIGEHPLLNNYTGAETEWYAISVPPSARAFTVGVQPTTQFVGLRFWKFNSDTQLYESVQNCGWKQGEFSGDLTVTGDDIIATINTKYDSAGSSYPDMPTNVYISFT